MGSTREVERIVGQIWQRRPRVEIVVRADSGFCRKGLMAGCKAHGVGSGLGFARHEQLRWVIAPPMEEQAQRQQATGRPAWAFTEFEYQTTTGSWSQARRVVARAERQEGKENPRSGVTNLSAER